MKKVFKTLVSGTVPVLLIAGMRASQAADNNAPADGAPGTPVAASQPVTPAHPPTVADDGGVVLRGPNGEMIILHVSSGIRP